MKEGKKSAGVSSACTRAGMGSRGARGQGGPLHGCSSAKRWRPPVSRDTAPEGPHMWVRTGRRSRQYLGWKSTRSGKKACAWGGRAEPSERRDVGKRHTEKEEEEEEEGSGERSLVRSAEEERSTWRRQLALQQRAGQQKLRACVCNEPGRPGTNQGPPGKSVDVVMAGRRGIACRCIFAMCLARTKDKQRGAKKPKQRRYERH